MYDSVTFGAVVFVIFYMLNDTTLTKSMQAFIDCCCINQISMTHRAADEITKIR